MSTRLPRTYPFTAFCIKLRVKTWLSALQLDISGMIGPAIGGALISLIGINTIFAANGACFLLINLAI